MRSVNFLINSLGNGGAERVVLALASYFVAQGVVVRIIALTRSCAYSLPEGVEVYYLSEGYDEESSSTQRMLLIPYYAWRLKKLVQRHKIPVIQSHLFRANYVNLFTLRLGSTHRAQVVNHSVASRFIGAGLSGRFNLTLIRWLYPSAERIVTISKRMSMDLQSLVAFDVPLCVIYNPYDIAMVQRAKEQPLEGAFHFYPHRRYLVAVGRLIPLKRYEDIIEALVALPSEVELIILGADGGSLGRLKSRVDDLNLISRVHFLGQVRNPFPYIKRADLLVLSSQTEGFPNVLIEAMLCGTPVIATDCVSGPREILAPELDPREQLRQGLIWARYGVLYPVGDCGALTKGVARLLDESMLRERYATRGYARATEFALEKIARLYQQLLERRDDSCPT